MKTLKDIWTERLINDNQHTLNLLEKNNWSIDLIDNNWQHLNLTDLETLLKNIQNETYLKNQKQLKYKLIKTPVIITMLVYNNEFAITMNINNKTTQFSIYTKWNSITQTILYDNIENKIISFIDAEYGFNMNLAELTYLLYLLDIEPEYDQEDECNE